MNVRIDNWKDYVVFISAIISAPFGVEICDLIKNKITFKEFIKKIKENLILILSLIGFVVFCITFILFKIIQKN